MMQRCLIKLYLGIYEGVMKEETDINRAIALAEQIQMMSYYDEEQRIHYFTEKIPAKEHSPNRMPHMQTALKKAVSELDREEKKKTHNKQSCPVNEYMDETVLSNDRKAVPLKAHAILLPDFPRSSHLYTGE